MSISTAQRPAEASGGTSGDLVLSVLASLASVAVSALSGFPKLDFPGADNDSLMRLVQVRDLLAGQGWFDLHQYRMGLEGGFIMHWSRLVDAPLAAIIMALGPVVGQERAELAAQFLWPTLLLAASILLLLRIARLYGGEPARVPALVIGTIALHFLYVFTPGSLDHHNLQLALILAAIAGLLSRTMAAGIAAGVAAAASIAVGMETVPYVAALGAVVAMLFWFGGEKEAPAAVGFGFGLSAGAAVFLLLTMRPAQWTLVSCDAFSGAQAASAFIAGLGMAAIGHVFDDAGRRSRFAALAGLGGGLVLFALLAFPQCLADPYSGLDQRLRVLWLDRVSEAQSLASMIVSDPANAALYYATPLLALFLVARTTLKQGVGRPLMVVAPALAAAFLVSAWQVRGATFSLAIATVPLAAWVGAIRERQAAMPTGVGNLRLAGAWLAALNVVWALSVGQVRQLAWGEEQEAPSPAAACEGANDYAALARLRTGTVAAISNLGAGILGFTGHRALSGPYHRNVAGNLAALDILTGDIGQARQKVALHGIDYVAICPGNPETAMLAGRATEGLMARLLRHDRPDWLEPVGQDAGEALRIFRVTK